MMVKKYHPINELLVACQTAGVTLIKISGALQERYNEDREAGELNLEGIDQAGNDVLKALAKFYGSTS